MVATVRVIVAYYTKKAIVRSSARHSKSVVALTSIPGWPGAGRMFNRVALAKNAAWQFMLDSK